MQTYDRLSWFADTWLLVLLALIFVGIVLWVFRPGSRKVHRDIAGQIFRNEDKPKDDTDGKD